MKLVNTINGQIVTDSKLVAETFKKSHCHVIRDIEALIRDTKEIDNAADFEDSNFIKSTYKDKQNKEKTCYTMTKDGFTLLAMGYGTKKALRFKIAYIKQFNAMEKELKEGTNRLANLGRAYLEYKRDKDIASECGRVLQAWKGKKKQHKKKIKVMESETQVSLLD